MENLVRDQISHMHEYVRLTAQVSMNWFFFACTINAAVAGWLIQKKGVNTARRLPALFIACDLTLAVSYLTVLPYYYCVSNGKINDLLTRFTVESGESWVVLKSPIPLIMWNLLAMALASTFLIMAVFWWYFFYTKKGRERLGKVAVDNSEQSGRPITGEPKT